MITKTVINFSFLASTVKRNVSSLYPLSMRCQRIREESLLPALVPTQADVTCYEEPINTSVVL